MTFARRRGIDLDSLQRRREGDDFCKESGTASLSHLSLLFRFEL